MREIQERNGEMRGWKQTGKEGVNDRGVREMGTEREEGTEEKRTRYGGCMRETEKTRNIT